ncbi:MAG TPA: hypothetical protein VGC21_19105 [Telluria sp.]|jgi:hypothetical protein
MKNNKYLLSALALAILSGCGALEQAPLVYASKVSVGVDISATSTETPGMGINVGYKQVDAAYVPVAVARKCATEDKAKCSEETYKIVTLNGNRSQEEGKAPTKEELASALLASNAASAVALKKQSQLIQVIADLSKTKTEAAKLDALQAEANEKKDNLEESTRIKAQIDVATGARDSLPGKTQTVEHAKNEFDDAQSAASREAEKYAKLVDASNGHNQNAKTDAFSVFGTFDANSANLLKPKEQEASATLKLGKVFSTGVASQNLTEGMAIYYAGMGSAACIENATKLILALPLAQRESTAMRAVAACESIASKKQR